MYLSDRDIRDLLDEMAFDSGDPERPFNPDEQIQPASIDLRLDSVFWRQRRKKVIDLRRSKLLEMSPRRHWRRVKVEHGEHIVLRPGQMLLGRIMEEGDVLGSL